MILDEDMTQNLLKELKEFNEKNGEENDNLCHEWNKKQTLEEKIEWSCWENQQQKEYACCGLIGNISRLEGDNRPQTEMIG